jgi:hypothetical protein
MVGRRKREWINGLKMKGQGKRARFIFSRKWRLFMIRRLHVEIGRNRRWNIKSWNSFVCLNFRVAAPIFLCIIVNFCASRSLDGQWEICYSHQKLWESSCIPSIAISKSWIQKSIMESLGIFNIFYNITASERKIQQFLISKEKIQKSQLKNIFWHINTFVYK